MRCKSLFCLLVLCAVLAAVGVASAQGPLPFLRGVNLGNMLDAPGEGAWGETFDCAYPKVIKAAGFDHVRLPVMWSIYTSKEPPYEIYHWILDRVDHVIAACREAELAVILDVHHYDELADGDPSKGKARFLAIWKQIAEHYASQPDDLYFELLNEPGIPPEFWNQWIHEVLPVIRQSNPTRRVLIGGSYGSDAKALMQLDLPKGDPNLIGSIHFYQPFEFTHQGAEWASIEDVAARPTWEGTEEQVRQIRDEFDAAQQWADVHALPVYLGEFGTYEAGDVPSRARWASAVAREAEIHGISWAYWDFCAQFGLYDNDAKVFVEPILHALIPAEP